MQLIVFPAQATSAHTSNIRRTIDEHSDSVQPRNGVVIGQAEGAYQDW